MAVGAVDSSAITFFARRSIRYPLGLNENLIASTAIFAVSVAIDLCLSLSSTRSALWALSLTNWVQTRKRSGSTYRSTERWLGCRFPDVPQRAVAHPRSSHGFGPCPVPAPPTFCIVATGATVVATVRHVVATAVVHVHASLTACADLHVASCVATKADYIVPSPQKLYHSPAEGMSLHSQSQGDPKRITVHAQPFSHDEDNCRVC